MDEVEEVEVYEVYEVEVVVIEDVNSAVPSLVVISNTYVLPKDVDVLTILVTSETVKEGTLCSVILFWMTKVTYSSVYYSFDKITGCLGVGCGRTYLTVSISVILILLSSEL